jgi:para-nitrobenzyl esterase
MAGVIDRRALLVSGAATLGLPEAARAAWKLPAVVRTTNGPVRGISAGMVLAYKGVRYGAPPVGPLRFKPPRKPSPWTATADATKFGAPAVQMTEAARLAEPASELARSMEAFAPYKQEAATDSEDCLFLNVWTPGLSGRRPVMVWLHGGGFSNGSGAWPAYDGTNLSKRGDVVVVTVNHRLNALGYLYLAELAGPAYAESGNAGMLDLVLALQWVRDNAARFGGDPRNVTIFGESGGGWKVSNLMAMPAAKGLFHKAIIQSGPGLKGVPKAKATADAKAILAELKIEPTAAALQSLDAEALVAAAQAVAARTGNPFGGGGPSLAPVVDGVVLPNDPFNPGAPALSRDIPLLVGANKDEMTLFLASQPWWGQLTEAQLAAMAPVVGGPRAPATIAALRKTRPGYSPSHLAAAAVSWAGLLGDSILLADRKAEQGGAPVYSYRLDWETPIGEGMLKTPHALEIPLVFDNVERSRMFVGPGDAPQRLADLMSAAWIAFARTGNPNTAGLPAWPKYDTAQRPTMVFDLPPRVVNDPEAEVRKAMHAA